MSILLVQRARYVLWVPPSLVRQDLSGARLGTPGAGSSTSITRRAAGKGERDLYAMRCLPYGNPAVRSS